MGRIVTHTGTFEHRGVDLSFTRWELERGYDFCSDFTPMVLLHGFAQSGQTWTQVASLLACAEGVGAVYALDLVGHGQSARPQDAAAYGMEAACASARDFCAWVARREGALPALVGYSLGGRIALECLVGASGSAVCADSACGGLPISALVLESAGLGPADEGERDALRERNVAWAARVREQGVSAFMDFWEQLPLFESQRSLPPVVREKLRAERELNDAEALARTLEGTGAHEQHARDDSLAALASAAQAGLPVRYLYGALDAKYVAAAALIAQEAPLVELVEIPEAGHNAHLEQPEAFAAAVLLETPFD